MAVRHEKLSLGGRGRLWGRRLGLLAAGLIVALLLLELGLRLAGFESQSPRWFDPAVGWRFHPDQVVHMRRGAKELGSATIGSEGYRAPAWAPPHPGDGLAIACIGDSFTFGWAVGDDESWPARLQQELDRALGAGRARVRNFGVPGWNTVNEERQYPFDVRPWQPSLVVIGFCLNDLQPEDRAPRFAQSPLLKVLRGTALLVAFQQHLEPRLPWPWFAAPPEPPQLTALRREYGPREREILAEPDGVGKPYWRRVDEALGRLVAEVRADGAIAVLAVFPGNQQVEMLRHAGIPADGSFGAVGRPQQHLAAVAADLRLPMLDLLPAFVALAVEPFQARDPGHPSSAAYAVAAREIHCFLRREGCLPEP